MCFQISSLILHRVRCFESGCICACYVASPTNEKYLLYSLKVTRLLANNHYLLTSTSHPLKWFSSNPSTAHEHCVPFFADLRASNLADWRSVPITNGLKDCVWCKKTREWEWSGSDDLSLVSVENMECFVACFNLEC